jgi:type I restriction enzyme S subunit
MAGGRAATDSVIPGRYAISVGNPKTALPPAWEWVPLSEISELGTGHTPSRNHPEYWDGDIPWIGIRDAHAHHGGNIADTAQSVTELGLQNSAARLLPKDTVCLSRTASVGYVVKMGREMATSQDFVTWSCGICLDPDFLMKALLAEGDDIRRFGEGSTHTTIYFPEVKAFHVALPPIREQRRIVAKLDALSARSKRVRAELGRVPGLLSRAKGAVLDRAFRGDLTAEWRRKFSDGCEPINPRSNEQLKRKYAVEVDDFEPPYALPPNWNWLRLPQLGDLDRGRSKQRPRNELGGRIAPDRLVKVL